jgi:hypothetical protein
MRRMMLLILFGWLTANGLLAADAAFDLAGPKVDVHVKRGEVTLPIGEVPSLLPGDRLWIHPDLPESQSAHYVLIVAFLRGATNPPPTEWFTRVETWNSDVREEGVFVVVPAEAQQALIFLAPETGGDFSTLRNAVRGRPGIFVRATQDLQAASLDRMRLETYLAEVKAAAQTDPLSLKDHAGLAARSLGIKVDQHCFEKPVDQQAACLSQLSEGMVMDDANVHSRVDQLASGSTLDLMNAISFSSLAGGGAYSPYFGAIVDTAKILSSLHTAHFQYIPALALPTKDTLNLRLNAPPSFRDPKSVVVVALPPIGASRPPPLHLLNPAQSYCLQSPGLVLPTESAPLVYGTQLVNSLKLHIDTKGAAVDLPLEPDPSKGGLVLAGGAPALPGAKGELTGVIQGRWGFDNWVGSGFHLRTNEADHWALAASDQSALVVGREDALHIEGDSTQCVERVEMKTGSGDPVKLTWKSPKPDALDIVAPMKDAAPGPVTLEIYQFGRSDPDKLALNAYTEAASLERLTLSAGDADAELKGTRLDEVAKAELGGITWIPAGLSRVQDLDQLTMKASGSTVSLEPGKRYTAKVQLHDGRQLKTQVTVNPPRPQVTLLNKGSQNDSGATPSPVHLGGPDDLFVEGRLVFFLKSRVPANFPRNEKVEVAAVDGSFGTTLSLADGSLMLEDQKTVVGSIEPLKRFGASAFGPLQARVVAADGGVGDWLPLGTLVRVPGFKELRCPRSTTKSCVLTGTNLFLVTAVALTPEFENGTDVPADFTGIQLTVPHPADGVLYVKLRDDPATVQTLTMPVTVAPPSPALPQVPEQAQPAATPSPTPETAPGTTQESAPDTTQAKPKHPAGAPSSLKPPAVAEKPAA